jgi:hypothetical protein
MFLEVFSLLLNTEERESELGCLGQFIVVVVLGTLGALFVLYIAGQLPWSPNYDAIFDYFHPE